MSYLNFCCFVLYLGHRGFSRQMSYFKFCYINGFLLPINSDNIFTSILSPIETISVWFITSPEEDSVATAKFLIKVI